MLDTLGLTQPVLETAIENRMVDRIKKVMLELGYGFAFMGVKCQLTLPVATTKVAG